MTNSNNGTWLQNEATCKVVVKPWGNATIGGVEGVGEVWLNYRKDEEIGDEEKSYVYKKLYIKAGSKLSFQYHVQKLETNYILSGRGEAWLENEEGIIEKLLIGPGDTWTIPRGKKHRIIALDDIVLLETSTPEVDDVVRIEDETNRGNGRIKSEHQQK